MKQETKLSLDVAKKMFPKESKAQHKRIALSMRKYQIYKTNELKKEINELKETVDLLKNLVYDINRRLMDKEYPHD